MVFSLINIKLRTLAISIVIISLILSFIIFVPSETKHSLVAPDGPMYFLTRASDLFKTHETLVQEKSVLLSSMAMNDNLEKSKLVFEEYKTYHGHYSLTVSENHDKNKIMMDFIVEQAVYFLKQTHDCPKRTLSFLKDAAILNLDLREEILEKLRNYGASNSLQIEEKTQEIIMEATPENLRGDIWNYMKTQKLS